MSLRNLGRIIHLFPDRQETMLNGNFVSTWKKTSVNAHAFRKTGELKMESLRGSGIQKRLPFSAKENLKWRQTFWV